MTSAGKIAADAPHRLVNEMVAAHATSLARRGRYAEAEELILPATASGSETPELLDLLARIRVQQGRADDASELWRQALAKDPANIKARAALDCLARNPHPAAKRITIVSVLFAAALLLPGFAITRGRHVSEKIRSNPATHARIQVSNLPDPDYFRSQYTSSEVGGESIQIGFARPVFAHNTRLTASGKLALADLAKRLRPFHERFDLAIIGKTDGVPVRKPALYSDNSILGLHRALAIYNELREWIPDLAIPKLSAEQSTGAAAMGDAKERTAIILLTAHRNHQ
jgi:tetratricopeptide (TPR) repeat protein